MLNFCLKFATYATVAVLAPVTALSQVSDPLDVRFRPAPQAARLTPPTGRDVPSQPVVWMTDSLAKVQPNSAAGSAPSISLYAARNEFESFQVHVFSGASPFQLTVTASDLTNSQTGQVISAASSIAVFREGYMNIVTPSDLNGLTGFVPDPLIPTADAYFHEQRKAFPFAVPANQVQSVWVDIFVPPGETSGYYTGSVTVMNGAAAIAVLPVQLTVWNFMLPSTATLKSSVAMFYNNLGQFSYGSDAGSAAYPGAGGNAETGIDLMHAAVAQMFLDHRVTISALYHSGIYPQGQWAPYDAIFSPVLNGTASTILQAAQVTSLSYPNYNVPNANISDVQDWTSHFTANNWLNKFYIQPCDEPPAGCSWANLAAGSSQLQTIAPTVPLLVTTDIAKATANNVLSGINILTPVVDSIQPMGSPSTRPNYNSWLQNPNTQLWWYQSCDEHESCANGTPGPITSTWPSYMIDASPVRNRIFQWMAYLYGIQGELYYMADNWGSTPWTSVYSSGGNGEGVLYYPGSAAQIGGTDPVPVASVRLKHIRDGMEDYEYLNALSQAGMSGLAQSASAAFVTNAYTFSNDPTQLQSARVTIGNALHQASLQPPPFSISSIGPPSFTAQGADTTLTVNGSNFVAGDTIRWSSPSSPGEISLSTTFVNSGQLTAPLSHTLLAAAGTAKITVRRNATEAAVTTALIVPNVPTTLGASIQSKSGPTNARVWSIQFTDNGPGVAGGVQISSLSLTQTAGAACTPIVGPMPPAISSIAAGSSASAQVTINFTGCVGTVRFRVSMPFTANGGLVSGTMTANNQVP